MRGACKPRLRFPARRPGLHSAASAGRTGAIVDGKSMLNWLPLLTGLLVPPMVYAAYRVICWTTLRRLALLMECQEYPAAVRHAAKSTWLPRVAEHATLAQAICLLHLGRPAEAKQVLRTSPWGGDRVRPARLYLSARAAAQEGDSAGAKDLLQICLSFSPGFAADASADAYLAPLLISPEPPVEGYA